MSSALEPSSSPNDSRTSDERKQSPPAFLDLADSAARLGTNMPDISARVELKRMEHERQRALQRKMFEDQMRALEQQQAQELLSIPLDANGNTIQHLAVSAPTTPPRVNSALGGEVSPNRLMMDPTLLSNAVGKADKRKSVTYAPMTTSLEYEHGVNEAVSGIPSSFARPAGAKSMPASRRTSASSHDEDLANHLQNLSMGERTASPAMMIHAPHAIERPKGQSVKFGNGNGYNAGVLLDEQLDKEMQNAMRHFPIPDDDRFGVTRSDAFTNKQLSTASAALDLAPLSQTPPRASYVHRPIDGRDKVSEWSQLSSGIPKGYEETVRREIKRNVTTPQLGMHSSLTDLSSAKLGTVSATGTPLIGQHTPGASRRSSPLGIPTTNLRPDVSQLVKTPGTPQSAVDSHGLGSRLVQHHLNDSAVSATDLSASLSRISSGQFEGSPLNFDSPRTLDEPLQNQYDVDSIYALNGQGIDGSRFNGYGFDANSRINATGTSAGSTALYHHGGARYGLGMGARLNNGPDTKMNGLHGPKHKRGDMDREFNRFAGTRLEDLQGEIASLCKDQHGCRYLQKKLEEGVPEHRDMIFRETFGHFAELMTDPFGNYLCQKLLEYATDEQRNLICESVAQDLVNISLNMHGTRAVQKMIDFLSTQRQTDLRYNTQIHSIIVALSLHVVVLIKDLNGNHVIQKCLNKLTPEDNQFIYNAVAANCVEVATHRHGCCVLQRCIDHASDHQKIQLVNEITYNALTLVQDPYGNYVVQYILDLNDNRFSDAVIRQFTGNVCALSVQKFSSNVIEKCIRVAEHNTRKMLIEELLNRTRLEKLLRDSFGNYCVQTALDYAEPTQRAILVEGIRPILPLIRNTPYGKRIQSKLQREQMEMQNQSNGLHYSSGGYPNQQQQQALMNIALVNQGLGGQGLSHNVHNLSQVRPIQNLPHGGGQLNDVYNARGSMYGLSQAGGSLQSLHLHGGQQIPPSLQSHASIDSYVLQGSNSHSLTSTPNGFSSVGGFSNGMPAAFGSSVGLTGGINDPYQRASYGYGM